MEISIIYGHLAGYIQMLLQQAIVLNLVKELWSPKKLLLSVTSIYIPYVVLLNIDFVSHNSMISRVLWLILLFVSYAVFYKIHVLKSGLMAILQITANASFESILIFLITFMPEWLRNYLVQHPYVMRYVVIVIFLVIFLITYRFRNRKHESGNYRANILWMAYFIFLFLLIQPVIIRIEQYNQGFVDNHLDFLNILLLIVLSMINIAYIRSIQRVSITEQQLEFQELYSNSLEKTTDELRGFKHDFSNIINTINGYIELNDMESLRIYMQQLNLDILNIKTTNMVNDELKRIPTLYGMFLPKINLAELMGIAFDIDIQTDIDSKYCSIVDYSRVIGILLDNAIEAAKDSTDKYVRFQLTAERDRQVIRIANSCDIEVDTKRIFEQGFSTKGQMGEGLYQIKNIIHKYEKRGYSIEINPLWIDGSFVQTVKI